MGAALSSPEIIGPKTRYRVRFGREPNGTAYASLDSVFDLMRRRKATLLELKKASVDKQTDGTWREIMRLDIDGLKEIFE